MNTSRLHEAIFIMALLGVMDEDGLGSYSLIEVCKRR